MNSILKIVKESGINFTGSTLGNILGYIWLVIMTRSLTQADFGVFSLAQTIINISLIIVLLGTHKSLDRYIPFYNSADQPGKVKTLLTAVFSLALVTSLVVGLLLFFGSGFLADKVFRDHSLFLLLRIIIFAIPLQAVTMIVIYAFGGYKELRYDVYLKQLLEPSLKIGFALLITLLGLSIVGWTWFYILALLITALVALAFLFKRILLPLSKVKGITIYFREIMSYSWPMSISSILIIIVGQIDFIFLGIYNSAAEIGIFRIYIQIVAILRLVTGSVARIFKPVISELIPEQKMLEIQETYTRVTKWITTLTALGTLVIILYGTRLTSLLFTEAYAVFPLALSILAMGTLINAIFGPSNYALEAFGNTRAILITSLGMVVANIGLDMALIPQYGVTGAAIAAGLTLALGGLASYLYSYFLYKMQPFTLDSLKLLLVCGITGGLFYLLDRWVVSGSLALFLLSILLMTAFYSGGVLLSRVVDEIDKDVVKRIIAKLAAVF